MADRRLLDDALRIWRAGLEAVRPERLFAHSIGVEGRCLTILNSRGEEAATVELDTVRRLHVVGGGKAGAAMVRGFEAALGEPLLREKHVSGVVSVPADCVATDTTIRVVAGRPAGMNEPRAEGAAATEQMLRIVDEAAADDLVVCLLSGGGSALLTAPEPPLTVNEKAAIVRAMSARGAPIEQINAVRQQVSRVKGGGLARACKAGRLITLVISDVIGDPLDLIASGPTIKPSHTPADALAYLEALQLLDEPELQGVVKTLRTLPAQRPPITTQSDVVMLANNAMAVDAAGAEAERLGYRHAMDAATVAEGLAEDVGGRMARMALSMRDAATPDSPDCLITGGEPTVELAAAEIRGVGGRNQQLALAALQQLGDADGVALVAGGTDGEDGPTDAAGAFVDASVIAKARDLKLDAPDALRRNDAYTFFQQADGLLQTGPTGTNVCDLRVVTVAKPVTGRFAAG